MSDELYEELFGRDSPPTTPSSVAAAPGHGEFERDETPEATDTDGVDSPQAPVEDTANVVDRSGTRCPSTLATPPGRALGGAAQLPGRPSSTATPPVALGVAGQAFEPVLPPLPPYPRAVAAQRGASLPRQLNASRPVVPLPQHAYGQAAAPFFQGHAGYGGMPPATAPQTFATGYASAAHIPQSNGLPYTGPAAHYPFNPAAYPYALRTGSQQVPASGSRAFPGAAQHNYSQPYSYYQYSGQFYGAYPMQVTGPRPNSPLYPSQGGQWGAASTAWPTAASRQPVPAGPWGYVSQNQNQRFTQAPAATGNSFNGGTAYGYYRNNVASLDAQQALAQGVSQPNFASTSTARAPQAQNVGVPQPCPPAVHMYPRPHAQDHRASGKKRLHPDSDPDFGVPPDVQPADVQPDAGMATHYGSVVAPRPSASKKRKPGKKRQSVKDKKKYLDPKFLKSLDGKTVEYLEASRPDVEENLYDCKLPVHRNAADRRHELLDGTLYGVRLHLWHFHDYPNPSRTAGSAKDELAAKLRCQWISEPGGAPCAKELKKRQMAQHVINCHILSDCFRCPSCKAACLDRMELAGHMNVCEYWNNGLVKGSQPFIRPKKIARRDGAEDVSGAGADVQTA